MVITADPSQIWSDGARARRPSLTDELADGVARFVGESDLSAGDRLPPVRSLAERFGVAAPTMREALRRLEAEGVLVMRHGSGVYVSREAARRVIGNPHASPADAKTILELLETRLLLEPTAAELASSRATPEGRDAARSWLELAASQLDDASSLNRTNLGFHVAIGRLSGNIVLAQTIEALLAGHRCEQAEILVLYEDSKRDYLEHRALLDAISSGDADAAHRTMFEHLVSVSEIVAGRAPVVGDA